MSLERGFRRLTLVVSVVVFGLGVMVNIMFPETNALGTTVQVTLEDGQTVVLDGPENYSWDRDALQKALLDRHELELRPMGEPIAQPDGTVRYPGEQRLTRIVDVKVLRRPAFWWWADTRVIQIALVVVGVIWTTFYVVRWIARGFGRG